MDLLRLGLERHEVLVLRESRGPALDADGTKYFYNSVTGQTSWERPQEGSSSG